MHDHPCMRMRLSSSRSRLIHMMLSTVFQEHHASWVLSHACRTVRQSWRELGYTSLEDFLVGFWEGFFMDRRALHAALQATR